MKRIKKIAPLILTAALASNILVGCSSDQKTAATAKNEKAKEDTVLQYQGSPGVVSFPELAENLGYLGDVKLDNIGTTSGGPEMIQLTGIGETDFGSAFNGAIIKAVTKGAKLKSVIGSYGSDENTYIGFYTLEGSAIKSPKDLIGKKIGVNTLGAHAEFVVKDYLRQAGVKEKDIAKVQLVTIPMANAEQTLRNKQIDVVQLSGVARDLALDRGGVRELFSDIKVFGEEFTAGAYFFTEEFIKANPNTVKTFVKGVSKAIEWQRTTPREEVIAKLEEIVKSRKGNEPTENLKFWKSTGIEKEGGAIADKEFQVWIDWLVKNGELKKGQIKPKDLYTNEFNPYKK